MRVSLLSRLFFTCSFVLVLFALLLAKPTINEAARLLPNKIGDATAQGKADAPRDGISEQSGTGNFEVISAASRRYILPNGGHFEFQIFKMPSDAAAYALFTTHRSSFENAPARFTNLTGIGIVALNSQREIEFVKSGDDVNASAGKVSVSEVIFSKGAFVVSISGDSTQDTNNNNLVTLARAFAETLDAGSGEIPALVKHLPDWETAQERAVYAVSLAALKEIVPDQPVLDALSFAGGMEAVAATYDQGARLLIVEYATPQLAFDGDAAITARIAGLRGEGKAVPSAYRRVGNYGVFVFVAPSEQAAQLIGKVRYEKDVRWLGDNPYAIERANRRWLNMSTSVIVNTVKVTGIAIVVCLGIGGIFGGAIFMRRRAQAALTQNFSDAGGMMRLNLDEMNVQNNPARLIEQSDK
ncbi:MAG: DUF6599 family protein [Pyrinomonadaceae bacterium]